MALSSGSAIEVAVEVQEKCSRSNSKVGTLREIESVRMNSLKSCQELLEISLQLFEGKTRNLPSVGNSLLTLISLTLSTLSHFPPHSHILYLPPPP
jgi:hypothetical protein